MQFLGMVESEHILHHIDVVNPQYNALLPNYECGFEMGIVPILATYTGSIEQIPVISFVIYLFLVSTTSPQTRRSQLAADKEYLICHY